MGPFHIDNFDGTFINARQAGVAEREFDPVPGCHMSVPPLLHHEVKTKTCKYCENFVRRGPRSNFQLASKRVREHERFCKQNPAGGENRNKRRLGRRKTSEKKRIQTLWSQLVQLNQRTPSKSELPTIPKERRRYKCSLSLSVSLSDSSLSS